MAINEKDLQRLLRLTAGETAESRNRPAPPDFAEGILARLPSVRWVIPGSNPGTPFLMLSALLGMAVAVTVSFWSTRPDSGRSHGTLAPPGLVPHAAGTEAGPALRPTLSLFHPREPEYRPAVTETNSSR
jgi:hypothetical protein